MIDLIIAISASITATIIILLIGFSMGRKTVINANMPTTPKNFDPGPATDAVGDYIGDELQGYDDNEKRIPTL